MIKWFAVAGAALAAVALLPFGGASAQSDAAVQRAIRQSIAAYPGSCPCPYSTDRAGRRCGARSAYNRPGGRAPLCYASDLRGQRPR
jgi:hypothetical protein